PPAADRLDREGPGVSVGADVHPSGIGRHVIDAVGDGPAKLALEVVHLHPFGLAAGMPFLPAVLIVTDQFLFLRINRDHRLTGRLERSHLLVDEPELAVPVRMLAAFYRLGFAPPLARPPRALAPAPPPPAVPAPPPSFPFAWAPHRGGAPGPPRVAGST